MGLTSLQVCLDSPDWFQGTIPDETGIDSSSPSGLTDPMLACSRPLMEPRLRPPQDHPLKCPRCDSTHTKFCYYNNYSLTQPRYFCKACRRYWTKGGTLRNIPVGGGCRKTKKVSSSSKKSTSSSASAGTANIINCDDNIISTIHHNHNYHQQNLNLINPNPNPNPNYNHRLIMNSTDLQLSYPESSMQFSGSSMFGINGNSSNATSFMFENLCGGGGGGGGGRYGAEMGGMNVIGHGYRGGNLCSPFGGMTLGSINNPFSERELISYNHEVNDNVIGCLDVKPNLLALEWQDDHTGGSGTSGGGGGYMTGGGSSWGGLVHGLNPLV